GFFYCFLSVQHKKRPILIGTSATPATACRWHDPRTALAATAVTPAATARRSGAWRVVKQFVRTCFIDWTTSTDPIPVCAPHL
ncbi:Hypothetical protein, putative, partial [Bodo saltans]